MAMFGHTHREAGPCAILQATVEGGSPKLCDFLLLARLRSGRFFWGDAMNWALCTAALVCTPMPSLDMCVIQLLTKHSTKTHHCREMDVTPATGNIAKALREALGTDYGYQICWRPAIGT